MLIEFCCPACRAALSVDNKVAGGQVNCPKCRELILIPMETPLRRVEDRDPFEAGQVRSVEDVKEAIAHSVAPYRMELDSKVKLLNDAVEMVKVRNNRIRELETMILGIQKELWELEVEFDERNEAYKRAQFERQELRRKVKEGSDTAAGNAADAEALRQTQEQLARESRELGEHRERVSELERKLESTDQLLKSRQAELENLQREKEEADARLKGLENSLSIRNEQLSEAVSQLSVMDALTAFTTGLIGDFERQEALLSERTQVLITAQDMLEGAENMLDRAANRIQQSRLRHEELLRERDAVQDQLARQKEAFSDRDRMLSELKARLDEQQNQVHSAQSSSSEQAKALASLEQKLNRSQKELLLREQRLQEVMQGQQDQLDKSIALEKQKSELSAMVQAESQRADAGQRKIENLQKTLEEQERDRVRESAAYQEERDRLISKLDAANQAESAARARVKQLEKETDALRKAVAEQPDMLETSPAASSAGKDQMQVLLEASRQELSELRAQYRALEDRNKAMQNRQAHDKAITERLVRVEKENRELQKARMELESQLSEAQRKMEKLSLSLEAASVAPPGQGSEGTSVSDLLREAKAKDAAIASFEEVKYRLERQIKDLGHENKRLQNTVKTLSANLKAQWKRGAPSR